MKYKSRRVVKRILSAILFISLFVVNPLSTDAAALPTSPTNYYGSGAVDYGNQYGVNYTNLPNSYEGNNLINKLYVGTQAIRQVFVDATLLWVDTYNYNFSINGSTYRVSIPYGENIFNWVSPPNVTMGGYTFKFIGWSTTPTAAAPNLGSSFISGTNEDATFYAIYRLDRTVQLKVVPVVHPSCAGMGSVSGGATKTANLSWYYVTSSNYTGAQTVSMYPDVPAYVAAYPATNYKFTSWSGDGKNTYWPGYGNAAGTYAYASYSYAYNSASTITTYFYAYFQQDIIYLVNSVSTYMATTGSVVQLGTNLSSYPNKTFYVEFRYLHGGGGIVKWGGNWITLGTTSTYEIYQCSPNGAAWDWDNPVRGTYNNDGWSTLSFSTNYGGYPLFRFGECGDSGIKIQIRKAWIQ